MSSAEQRPPQQRPGPESVDPRPLEYQRPGRVAGPRRTGSPLLRFLAGLGVGAAVSLLVWGQGWNRFVENGVNHPGALHGVPGIKVFAAVFCMFFPGARAFGAGLLVSVALGALIFSAVARTTSSCDR